MTGRASASRQAARLAALAVATVVAGLAHGAAGRQAPSTSDGSVNTPPRVEIVRPDASRVWRWGAQFRYTITVSDKEDGESAFDEITPTAVLLEVEYLPAKTAGADDRTSSAATAVDPGLAVLQTSACFACHADKTSLVGPSFAAIADRYGDHTGAVARLGRHIREGSSGTWGTLAMPPHAHLSPQQSEDAARFIVVQGRQRHRWVHAGLEGLIRIIDRPGDADAGFYRLTASYQDKGTNGAADTSLRGEHSVMLRIE